MKKSIIVALLFVAASATANTEDYGLIGPMPDTYESVEVLPPAVPDEVFELLPLNIPTELPAPPAPAKAEVKKPGKVVIGVGHLVGPSVSLEIRINKEDDKLRLLFHADAVYKVNTMAILYQPSIKPLFWSVKPLVAVGFGVGYWTDRTSSIPDADGKPQNSHWKKNPAITMEGMLGVEVGLGDRFAVEGFGHYGLHLNHNEFGTPKAGFSVKIRLGK